LGFIKALGRGFEITQREVGEDGVIGVEKAREAPEFKMIEGRRCAPKKEKLYERERPAVERVNVPQDSCARRACLNPRCTPPSPSPPNESIIHESPAENDLTTFPSTPSGQLHLNSGPHLSPIQNVLLSPRP
jgi:hypothetical protein